MMADKTITQLTAAASAAASDEIPLWVAGSAVTRKITKANFLTGYGALATASTWTAAQTMQAGINIGVAASALTRQTGGVVRQAVETNTIANNGALVVSPSNVALIYLLDASDGAFAIISIVAATGVIVSGSTSVFSVTAGTASRVNVYYSAGTGIIVENKRGSTITVSAIVMF